MTPSRLGRRSQTYELLPRSSLDIPDTASASSWVSIIADALPSGVKRSPSTYAHYITPRRRKRSILRLIYWSLFVVPYLAIALVFIVGLFFPSYTNPPAHYQELRKLAFQETVPGRANTRKEKVFIAASLYELDGYLTSGPWGEQVLELIDLLGPDNVYLSIYENSPDAGTRKSLHNFERKVKCNSSIVYEDLDLATLPRVPLPNGETRLKRMAFLAEVRNRALAPIDEAGIAFDRVLYLNDVNFKPIEAAQLLFSTNIDASGRADYGAACAMDFIDPFKFYDRYALRDFDGYTSGVPIFPWFTTAGTATSRNDVLAGTDAVRVRSCWGGMIAYEAKWFQDQTRLHGDKDLSSSLSNTTSTPSSSPNPMSDGPLRFRYQKDTFWDASECCLINADLQVLRTGSAMPADSGIYVNPYIRVAYTPNTLSWLSLLRRPERILSPVHDLISRWVGFPSNNVRRLEEPGETYTDTVWEYDDPVAAFSANATTEDLAGKWVEQEHVATPGGFCGGRNLLVINEDAAPGESHWGKVNWPRPPTV